MRNHGTGGSAQRKTMEVQFEFILDVTPTEAEKWNWNRPNVVWNSDDGILIFKFHVNEA